MGYIRSNEDYYAKMEEGDLIRAVSGGSRSSSCSAVVDAFPWLAGSNLDTPLSAGRPWSLPETLAKLLEAAEILMDDKGFDGHGHELIQAAREEAQEFLKQNA